MPNYTGTSKTNWLLHDFCVVYCIVVSYFAYQCSFDDQLFCCEACATDIDLSKTTFFTYLLTFIFYATQAERKLHYVLTPSIRLPNIADNLGLISQRSRSSRKKCDKHYRSSLAVYCWQAAERKHCLPVYDYDCLLCLSTTNSKHCYYCANYIYSVSQKIPP